VRRFEAVELAPFTAAQMQALVADVASYPRFVPWTKAARIWGRRESGAGRDDFSAEVIVGYKAFRARFATSVAVDTGGQTIATALIEGPFKALMCLWRFADSPGGCLIEVAIDFEFSERVLQSLLEANMDKAVTRLMEAFTAEAKKRYAATSAAGAA
jgi:coenzyme Q-binding protein COQ10